MKRRTIVQYSLIVFFALTIFVIGSAFLVQNNLNKVSSVHLQQYLILVKIDLTNQQSPNQVISKYYPISENLRITYVSETGQVIADTFGELSENHLNREEIQNPGSIVFRYSNTLGRKMLYLAEQLPSGNYVRLAIPQSSLLPFLNDFIGFSILVSVIIIVVAVLFIVGIVHLNLRPLQAIESALVAIANGGYAERLTMEKEEEVNRIISRLNEINHLISDNLIRLSAEKQKNDFILDQMLGGLAVLNQVGEVVLSNRFMKELFQVQESVSRHTHYLYWFRHHVLHKTIEKVYHQYGSLTSFFEIDQKYYQVYANYLPQAWNQEPCVLLLVSDVTPLKDVEVTKRDFFANASHELKSPLTSILGSAELITTGFVKKEEEVQDLAVRIVQEARRMNTLVYDMLSLSKFENILLERGQDQVDLAALCEDIKHRIEPIAELKNMKIELAMQSVLLQGSYEHLFELVHNLVENAVKYGKFDGLVRITLSKSDFDALIVVEDNGIGIPKNLQSRVFERFFQIDPSRSQNIIGTGLGLAIVKHIVLLYQGQIQLQSEVEKGTKITVQLPLQG